MIVHIMRPFWKSTNSAGILQASSNSQRGIRGKLAGSASSRASRKNEMGTSSSNFWGATKKILGAEVPSGQGVESTEDMVCDPQISNSTTINIAENKGNAEKGVDAAVPTEGNAGMNLPQPGNYNPSPMFNDVNGNFGRTDLASFAMVLQTPPTQGISDCSSYRSYNVIDIIRFLEGRNREISEFAATRIEHLQSQIAALEDQHQQQAISPNGKMQEMTLSLHAAQAEVESTTQKLAAAESDLQIHTKKIETIQGELMEEKKRSSDWKKSQYSTLKRIHDMKVDLEIKLRQEEVAGAAKDREVQRLGSINQEKDKALGHTQSAIYQLTSENQKLKGQLAAIEKKSAQESLTSGSYTEGHANPSLLVSAGQAVDQAMDRFAKFLYENSLMRGTSLKTPELERLIGAISRARPGDFSRPAHVKHVWGHWICVNMFQGFEHVYFDVPVDQTSPLDLEKHALDRFQTFLQKKDVPSLGFFKECDLFREFCEKMLSLVFPTYLIDDARLMDSGTKFSKSTSGIGGSWEEPADLKGLFLDVAKAIWLLHELAFAFHPAASILRMGWGEPFDKEYHEPVIKDADNNGLPLKVVLTLRPGFRVKKSVIKSRVFLSQIP